MAILPDNFGAGPAKSTGQGPIPGERGADGGPRLITIGELLAERNPVSLDKMRNALAQAPTPTLENVLAKMVTEGNRAIASLINRELTHRGIPPSFRRCLWINADDVHALMDSLWIDLQWICSTDPGHVPFFKRWHNVMNEIHFDKQVRYIFNGIRRGKSQMYKAAKGLALTKDQEVECHYLRPDRLNAQRAHLDKERDGVRLALKSAYINRQYVHRGNKTVVLNATDQQILDRRLLVWECAHLANFKPQRTADYCNAMTGAGNSLAPGGPERMNRQQVANTMTDIKRDLSKQQAKLW